MQLLKYIKELKRRNVFKAAIAYLVVAWLIIQVASIVLPVFEAPPYLIKTVFFVLCIGFVIWIVFAWTYDVTEDGIKKTKSIKSESTNKIQTGNRLSRVIIVGLSLAVILLLYNQFGLKEPIAAQNELAISSTQLSSKKMAVLPFLNTKPNSDSDYLGFALADQIIGGLVYVNAINIRPSSAIRKYENTAINPTQIGDELDVEYLLQGNYLMEGKEIRLNIELINTQTNSIILREPLQLNFQSAFELQDIVSKKIIDKLKLHFEPNEQNRIRKNTPTNTLAYEYYLRAVSYPHTTKENELAIEMLKKTIDLDSTFAPAFSELGSRTQSLANYGLKGEKETEKATQYFLKALSLNNELISAYYGLSAIYTESGQTKKSIETIRKILDINPNDGETHKYLGYIYRYAGLLEESVSEMTKAELLDKNVSTTIYIAYIALGEYEKAISSIESQIIKQNKASTLNLGFLGIIKYRQGKYDEAMKIFDEIHELDPNSLNDIWVTAFVALMENDIEKGLKAVQKFESYNINDSEAWFHIGVNYALLGDKEGALRLLTRAAKGGYFNYPSFLNEPFLDSLRDDDEFKKLLKLVEEKHLDFKKDVLIL